MATYKVIQDIEAEDKILGPLTLRQFIYGLIAVFFLYISFIVLTKGAPFLLIVFLPPALFAGFFAFPFGRDQPTEVWALAKIRFLFKPRLRLWDQSGVKELVTITVPKRVEQYLTNGLSANEVQSRLKALADTIDSRGWAIKNVNVNLYSQTGLLGSSNSDRLIDITNMPREVPSYDVQPADDILDEANNPVAHKFESLINASTQTHHQRLIDGLNAIRAEHPSTPATAPNDYWFMNQSLDPGDLPASQAIFANAQIVQPGAEAATALAPDNKAAEAALSAQLKAQNASQQVSYSHLRTIQPLNDGQAVRLNQQPATNQPPTPSPAGHNPAILSLANNNDLNVATLARQAYKVKNPNQPPEDEVVISLR